MERRYYRVNEGPVMDVINSACGIQKEFADVVRALRAEFGADVWVSNNSRFIGLSFPGDLPAGWRKSKQYAVPDKRVKAGRELDKRFRALPRGMDAVRFTGLISGALGEPYDHYDNHVIGWTIYQKFGDTWILSVPAGCKVTPPNCDELKMSEYWALKESVSDSTGEAEL